MASSDQTIKNLCSALARGEEFTEAVKKNLLQLGFQVPSSAWKNLAVIYRHTNFEKLFPDFFPALIKSLSLSFDPGRGLNNFDRFSEQIFDKDYLYTLLSTQEKLLTHLTALFSGSQHLTDLLIKEPETFNWLQLPDTLARPKLKDHLYRESWEIISKCRGESEFYSAIRKFKKREYLRIGLRDLTRSASLKKTLGEIANLADVCLQHCYEYFMAELVEKHGHPVYQDDNGEEKPCEFTIIGMGKLGGLELNYSSDIDLLYVYTSEKGGTKPENSMQRALSNHEFFTKLARKITAAMNKLTAEGSVFRVDLGLRPEGSSGDIVSSIRSYEVYYESWGRTWERMALLKARPCAGNKPLGKEFMLMCKPFVYRKYLDFSALDEVKEMKEKIDKEVLSQKGKTRNVKLGYGGIREIEFVVQVFNLIYGGKDRHIRINNLLRSLDKLFHCQYISKTERDNLRDAYVFLRELENRIQISYSLQTQEMPKDPKELATLALKMGIKGGNGEELVKNLQEVYSANTEKVREIYNRLFYEKELEDDHKPMGEQPSEENSEKEIEALDEEILSPYPFREPKRILKDLLLMRNGAPFSHPSPKSIARFDTLLPRIITLAAKQPDPDQAVNNLEKFLKRTDSRDTFYEMMVLHREALFLLLTLFGHSELLSKTLLNQPYLLDSVFGLEWLHKFKPGEILAEELMENLTGITDHHARNEKLSNFIRAEQFRVGLRYLLKETTYEDMIGDLSTLAELYLAHVLCLALDSLTTEPVDPKECGFAIIGMGKFGGREIDYGSDLDIIFVHDEKKKPLLENLKTGSPEEFFSMTAKSIYKWASHQSSVGSIYKMDADLRPEGGKGTLSTSIWRFPEYLEKRALTWERQSLIKARFIAGDEELGNRFLTLVNDFIYRDSIPFSEIADIRRLRKRVEVENVSKNKNAKNIKIGPGGLMDIEFITQLLQLKHGYREKRLRTTSTLEGLAQIKRLGYLSPSDCEFLVDAYWFLRQVITTMRINREGGANVLPADLVQLHKLALSMDFARKSEKLSDEAGGGFTASALFLKECAEWMARVREIYEKVFTVQTGSAEEG